MPRYRIHRTLVAEVLPERRAALVSCPALGVLSPRRRLVRVFAECVLRALDPAAAPGDSVRGRGWHVWTPEDYSDHHRAHHHVLLGTRALGAARMVVGMVVTNEPWRTVPRLGSAMAAAGATSAFGVFYTSIWEMAAALSTARMALIGVMAVVSMVLWLHHGHRLWDRPPGRPGRYGTVVYNVSTVLTLVLCVLALYTALFAGVLLASVVVIDPGFLSSTLGEEAGPEHYLDIAWMSAAIGVVAGSLGTQFDSGTDFRTLTHGRREHTRILEAEEDEQDSPSRTSS
ncbi:hypothetical protein [Brevibacterium litoralis]|uniref:hypothetical protein n=1 Tax=Brevibacterium litoralis TaxID=3138935 RepID=UPI0032EF791F